MTDLTRHYYDTNISLISEFYPKATLKPTPQYNNGVAGSPHPALIKLAQTLGGQAGRHFQKHRYEGLGRISLIQHQIKRENE